MTTRVIFSSKEKDALVSGTHEEPQVKILEASEYDRRILVDCGDFSLLLDSVATGHPSPLTRLFVFNAKNPECIPEKEGLYLPYVQKIRFEGNSRKEQG